MSASESSELVDYMTTVHQEIVRSGTYPFSCGLISLDVAELLLRSEVESRTPMVAALVGTEIVDFMGRTSPLIPRVFQGRVKWGAHLVCVEGGLAYDPLVSEPTPLSAYLGEAFTLRPRVDRTFKGRELAQLITERPDMVDNIHQNGPANIVTDLQQLRVPH